MASYGNGRRITGAVRLPGAAYGSSRRHGRRAPSSKQSTNNYNNPLLMIQPRKRTTTSTSVNKNSAVRGHAAGNRTKSVTTTSKRTGSSRQASGTSKNINSKNSGARNTSARNGRTGGTTAHSSRVTAAAPRSSQHRAVGKSSSLQVGQYLVGKTIGQGTFGKVKLGVHAGTGEKVAIKILEKRKIVEVADVERVSREILILKRVGAVHDNVIRLFEVIDTPKAIYLIMEYCSGGELFDYIVKQGRIKERQACNFFHQILHGCEYLHQNNIVHRDLKPENLLIDDVGYVKIVDFGFAKVIESKSYTLCGTPEYLAPEIVLAKGHNKGVDYWALGVLIYEMRHTVSPYAQDCDVNDHVAICKNIVKNQLRFPQGCSNTPCAKMIQGLLTTQPHMRLGCMAGGATDIKSHAFYKGKYLSFYKLLH